ncbi:MAG: hypothetical protein WDO70_12280 [Alphaproteobacteria bacterium]
MTNRVIYWKAIGFSILALLLTVAYALRVYSNNDLRRVIDARQQQINAAQPLGQLYQGVAQSLMGYAMERDDRAVRDFLTQEGIEVPAAKPAAPTPQDSPAKPAPTKSK